MDVVKCLGDSRLKWVISICHEAETLRPMYAFLALILDSRELKTFGIMTAVGIDFCSVHEAYPVPCKAFRAKKW